MSPAELSTLSAPTKLDRAIFAIFPGWAAKRAHARREFAYEAARSTRLRASATRLETPEGYGAFPDRLGLIRQVRDLEQNFGLFQGIIDKLSLYAFGEMRYQARTGDEAINQQIESWVAECMDHADLSRRHHFSELVPIAFKSELRDGDFLNAFRRDGNYLKLQGIESDRCGGNVDSHTGAENWFQGIHVDLDTGAPLAYDVYRRTKANTYCDPVAIPASDIVHLFDPRRIDQYRGITPFAPICNEARDLKEVLQACLIGTKFENMHGAIGYTPSGQPLSQPSELIESTETTANGGTVYEQELKPGMVQWAPSTSEISFIKSDRPSGTFQTYIDLLVRLEAIALNLPFSFIYSLLGLTGPAVRADLQTAHRTIRWHQRNVTRRLCQPVIEMWIIDGIAKGKISYTPNWKKGKFFYAPAVSIDAGRDSSAKVAERNAGLRSEDSIFAEDGEDASEQKEIIARETRETIDMAQSIADETGVDLPIVLTMLGGRTPNGFLFTTPGADGQSASELIEAKLESDAASAENVGGVPSPRSSEMSDARKLTDIRALITTARARPRQLAAALDQRRAAPAPSPNAAAIARNAQIRRRLDDALKQYRRN